MPDKPPINLNDLLRQRTVEGEHIPKTDDTVFPRDELSISLNIE
jgi:hypothetical protein